MKNKFYVLDEDYSIRKDDTGRLFLSMNNNENFLNCEITGIYNGVFLAKYLDPTDHKDIKFEDVQKEAYTHLENINEDIDGRINIEFIDGGKRKVSDNFYISNDKKEIIIQSNDRFIKFDVSEENIKKMNDFNTNLDFIINRSSDNFCYYNAERENTNLVILSPYVKLNAEIFSQIETNNVSYSKEFKFDFNGFDKKNSDDIVLSSSKLEISGNDYFFEKIEDESLDSGISKFNIYLKNNGYLIKSECSLSKNDFYQNEQLEKIDNILEKQKENCVDLEGFKKISFDYKGIRNNKIVLEDLNSDKNNRFNLETNDFYLIKKENENNVDYSIVISKFNNFISTINITEEEYKHISDKFHSELKKNGSLESFENSEVLYTSKYSINNEYVPSIKVVTDGMTYMLNDYQNEDNVNRTIQGMFINKENDFVFVINKDDKVSLVTAESVVDQDSNILSKNDLIDIMEYVNLDNKFVDNKIFLNSDDLERINGTCNFNFNDALNRNYVLENVSINNKEISANLILDNEKIYVQLKDVKIIDEENRVIQANLNGNKKYFIVDSIENDKSFEDFAKIFKEHNFQENKENILSDVKFGKVISQFTNEDGNIQYGEKVVLTGLDQYNQEIRFELSNTDKVNLQLGIIVQNNQVYYMNDCSLRNDQTSYNYEKIREQEIIKDYIFEVKSNKEKEGLPILQTVKIFDAISAEDIGFKGNDFSLTYKLGKEEKKIENISLIDRQNRILYGKVDNEYKYIVINENEQRKLNEFLDYYQMQETKNNFDINFYQDEKGSIFVKEKEDFAYSVIDIKNNLIFDLEGKSYKIEKENLKEFRDYVKDEKREVIKLNDKCTFSDKSNSIEVVMKDKTIFSIDNVSVISSKGNENIISGEIKGETKYFSIHNKNKEKFEEFVNKHNLVEDNQNLKLIEANKELFLVADVPKLEIYNDRFNDDLTYIKNSNLNYISEITKETVSLNNWNLDVVGENIVIKGQIKDRDGNEISIKAEVQDVGNDKEKFYVMVKDHKEVDHKIYLSNPEEQQFLKLEASNNDLKSLYNECKRKASIYETYNYKNIDENNIDKYRRFFDKNNVMFQLDNNKDGVFIVKDNEFVNLNDRTERVSFNQVIEQNLIVNEIILNNKELNDFMKNYSNNVYQQPNVSISNNNVVELKFEDNLSFKYYGMNIDKEFNKESIEKMDFSNILNSEDKNKIIETFINKAKSFEDLKNTVEFLKNSNDNNMKVTKKDFIRINTLVEETQTAINELNKQNKDENRIKYCQEIIDKVERIEKYIENINNKNELYNDSVKALEGKYFDKIERIEKLTDANINFFKDDIFAMNTIRNNIINTMSEYDVYKNDTLNLPIDVSELIKKGEIIENNMISKIDSYRELSGFSEDFYKKMEDIYSIEKSIGVNPGKEKVDMKIKEDGTVAEQHFETFIVNKDGHVSFASMDKEKISEFLNDLKEVTEKLSKKYDFDRGVEHIKIVPNDIELLKESYMKLECIKKFEENNELKENQVDKNIEQISKNLDNIIVKMENVNTVVNETINESNKGLNSIENIKEEANKVLEKVQDRTKELEEAKKELDMEKENNARSVFRE